MKKEKILELLKQTNDYVSGQSLAHQLGVSRNTVWKAIKALEEDGYEIESQTNRGYRLKELTSQLSALELTQLAPWLKDRLILHPTIGSTNTWLKENQDNLPDRTIVLTSDQTGGRGRQGRSFYSSGGSGIYLSVLYRGANLPDPGFITLAAGLAVVELLEKSGFDPSIKWVNDVFLSQHKVCGILTEGELELESGQMKYLILGIGLNVNHSSFPPELESIATSLALQSGHRFNLNHLTVSLISILDRMMPQISLSLDPAIFRQNTDSLVEQFNRRLYAKGEEVTLSGGSQTLITGRLIGIDSQGRLILETVSGQKAFPYGEYRLTGTAPDPQQN